MTTNTLDRPLPARLTVAGSGRGESRTGPGVVAIEHFLEHVYELGQAGDLQAATDKVFDYVDQLLLDESFAVANAILGRAEVRKLPSALLRSFLTITYAAKDKLPARRAFYDQVRQEIVRRKGSDSAERLLGNLA